MRYFILVIESTLGTAILAAMIAADQRAAEPSRRLWPAAAAGVTGALIFAALLRWARFINRGFVNTGILLLALIAGPLFVLFSLRPGRRSGRIAGVSAQVLTSALLVYALTPVLLYPAEFVLPGEAVFTTAFLFQFIGWALGICLCALVGLGLFRIAVNIPAGGERGVLRAVLVFGLGVNGVRQLTAILQFLMARRIIPVNLFLFKIVAVIANHHRVLLYILTALGALVPVLYLSASRSAGAQKEFPNPGERRKYRARIRRLRRNCGASAAGLLLGLCAVTAVKGRIEQGVALSPAEPFTLAGDIITLPVENLRDGRLHRFAWNASDSTEVRFIVILKNESAFGVGLDACDICGATGYYQRKDEVICKLCDVVMNKQTIGFKGGCNPVPLAFRIENGRMLVHTGDLEKEKGRFK